MTREDEPYSGTLEALDRVACVVHDVPLAAGTRHRQEVVVLNHMRRLGGDILAIADFAGNEINALGEVIRLQSDLPPWARSALYLPNLQLMAYYRAIARGQNPDRPNNLAAVIKIDTFR